MHDNCSILINDHVDKMGDANGGMEAKRTGYKAC